MKLRLWGLLLVLAASLPGPLIDGEQAVPEGEHRIVCNGSPCAIDWPPPICPDEPAPGAGATPGGPYATDLTETEQSWRPLVARFFCHDYAIEEALHVLACESNGDPNVVNPLSGVTGLFQIHPIWFDHPEMDDPFDPEDNTRFAAWLWNDSGGWWHWHCRPIP